MCVCVCVCVCVCAHVCWCGLCRTNSHDATHAASHTFLDWSHKPGISLVLGACNQLRVMQKLQKEVTRWPLPASESKGLRALRRPVDGNSTAMWPNPCYTDGALKIVQSPESWRWTCLALVCKHCGSLSSTKRGPHSPGIIHDKRRITKAKQ